MEPYAKYIVIAASIIIFILVGIGCSHIRGRVVQPDEINLAASIADGIVSIIKKIPQFEESGAQEVTIAIFKEVQKRLKMVADGQVSPDEINELHDYIFEGVESTVPPDYRAYYDLVRVGTKAILRIRVMSVDLDYSKEAESYIKLLEVVVDKVIVGLEK
jgi:hypothetical protein